MPFAGTSHRPVGVGAVLGVLALIAGAVAWWAGGASATPGGPPVTAAVTTVPEPTTSPSTTSSSTSSSTTTSTTSTSTTVKPKRMTTTTPVPRTTPPTAPPTTRAPVAPASAPSSAAQAAGTSPEARCAAARLWVARHGLALPAGWGFRCPGSAVLGGTPRWGVACWNCEGTGSWISIDIGRIGPSDATLRHVIAHETCHALEYTTLGLTTELTADLCAALHGAPVP